MPEMAQPEMSQPEMSQPEMSLGLPVLTADQVADELTSWPIVAHEVLAEGRAFDFVSDEVAVPSGGTMRREYIEHTGAVGVIALDEGGRVAVVRQYRHPAGMTLVEPAAGLLDSGDDSDLAAAQREVAGELQLAASGWRVLLDVFNSPGCLQESLRIYLARGLSRTERPDGFELEGEEAHMEAAFVALDDLVEAIYSGRVQNPTMVNGTLALKTALLTGRIDSLRAPVALWPAREAKRRRTKELSHLR